ncbi:MAG: sugar phosphate isomerase/epimerase family protein [Planctomycetota bacterium]|jgi:sugar phosphate isomerase/epimerase
MRDEKTKLSRRDFLGTAAAATAASIVPVRALAAAGRPNSLFGGVQIGVITYSYRSMRGGAKETLKYVVDSGISSIELMGNIPERFAKDWVKRNGGDGGDPMAGFKALRKMYNDAGVGIHIVKFGNIGSGKMSDEQIDRYFEIAKALGARGITREISGGAAKRLGPLADKHKIMIGFHNHTQLRPTTYDGDILSHGKYLGINLDIGHYMAGTGQSAIPLIEKHHKRILSLHLKDRCRNNGPNKPFGQGDTPVAEVLQLMKRNKLTFPADVELEYRIPKGSNAVKEVANCVAFCRNALA